MNRDEAVTILADIIKEIVVSEKYRNKKKVLESELARRNFPFTDKPLMLKVIPHLRIIIRLCLDEAAKSEGDQAVLLLRSAEMFGLAGRMLEKKVSCS